MRCIVHDASHIKVVVSFLDFTVLRNRAAQNLAFAFSFRQLVLVFPKSPTEYLTGFSLLRHYLCWLPSVTSVNRYLNFLDLRASCPVWNSIPL